MSLTYRQSNYDSLVPVSPLIFFRHLVYGSKKSVRPPHLHIDYVWIRQKLLGIEVSNLVRAIQAADGAKSLLPKQIDVGMAFIKPLSNSRQRAAKFCFLVDTKMNELLGYQLFDIAGSRRIAERR